MKSRRHVSSLILSLVIGVSVVAPRAEAATLLVRTGTGGHRWIAVKFSTDGTTVDATMAARSAKFPRHGGSLLYNQARTPVSPNIMYADIGNDTGARAELNAPGLPGTSAGSITPFSAISDLSFSKSVTGSGIFYFLFWVAADASDWTFTLTGGPGVQVLAVTDGPETFVATSKNFTSTAAAWVAPALPLVAIGGRAQVGGTLSVAISRTWVGSFIAGAQSHNSMSVTVPGGQQISCPCSSSAATLPPGTGPGNYTFSVTGGGAGFNNLTEILVGGADPVLPN